MRENDDSREAIASRLEAVREILTLTKRQFAEQAGMSEQAYNGYSKATRSLSLEAAKKFRQTYGLTLEFMYFGNKADLPHRIAKDL